MRRTPLRRVSRKRAREQRKRVAEFVRRLPGVQPCGITLARMTAGMEPLPGCGVHADDAHESLRRSQGGAITDMTIIVPACRSCHDVVTFTPRSKLGWAYETNPPVLRRRGEAV